MTFSAFCAQTDLHITDGLFTSWLLSQIEPAKAQCFVRYMAVTNMNVLGEPLLVNKRSHMAAYRRIACRS